MLLDILLLIIKTLYFNKENTNEVTVLVATSGDTGSAAINAFKGKEDIQVFILHPYQMVSEVQRRQMTTVDDSNIHNIALKGTFDDCQKIVKNLFLDVEAQSKTSFIAVNSINWARLIAQAVYYFWAYTQLDSDKISFIVPSGNFGNIFSARLTKCMGLHSRAAHHWDSLGQAFSHFGNISRFSGTQYLNIRSPSRLIIYEST